MPPTNEKRELLVLFVRHCSSMSRGTWQSSREMNSMARVSLSTRGCVYRSWPEVVPPVDSGQRGPESGGGEGKEAAPGDVMLCLRSYAL